MLHEYNKPNGNGFTRLFKATLCSVRGFSFAWRFEASFRQEVILAAILFPSTFFLAESIAHWSVLVFALCLLIFAEILNSALETLADRITLEHDVMIGRAKDLGSAAVVIALGLIALLWLAAIFALIWPAGFGLF